MGQRAVGRPRDGNPAETRREILRAAEESFAAAGFAGATTRQVAARAGVNVATLHYHFGNKEGLYRAVLEEAISGRLPSPDAGGLPEDRLARLVSQIWDFGDSRPSLARLSLFDRLAGPRPQAAGPGGGGDDPRVALLSRAIAGMGNGGPPPPLGADAAARVIVALVDGAHLAATEAESHEAAAVSRDAVVAAALRLCMGAAAPPR